MLLPTVPFTELTQGQANAIEMNVNIKGIIQIFKGSSLGLGTELGSSHTWSQNDLKAIRKIKQTKDLARIMTAFIDDHISTDEQYKTFRPVLKTKED